MNKAHRVLLALLVISIAAVWPQPSSFAGGKMGDGRVLSKVTFIHYRQGFGKPPGTPGNGPGGDKTQDAGYYTYISKGARWRTLEDFVVNPTNGEGLSAAFVATTMAAGMDEWETYGGTIFGGLGIDYGAGFNDGALDGVNSFSFGAYGDGNVIAVTNVWGYFGGPPSGREIIEADILFNEAFVWGDADFVPSAMDLLNIAVHEIGHCAGMGDLYDLKADLETMYGYSTEGETIKRDLYTGDIAGITKLYN